MRRQPTPGTSTRSGQPQPRRTRPTTRPERRRNTLAPGTGRLALLFASPQPNQPTRGWRRQRVRRRPVVRSAAAHSGAGRDRTGQPPAQPAGTRWSSQPATQVPEIHPPGNSIRGPAEALHQPIHHQRDPDRVGNVKPTGRSASATRPSTSTTLSTRCACRSSSRTTPPARRSPAATSSTGTPTPMKGAGLPRLTPPAVAQRDR